jgi:hypothetical protein
LSDTLPLYPTDNELFVLQTSFALLSVKFFITENLFQLFIFLFCRMAAGASGTISAATAALIFIILANAENYAENT